MLKEVPTTVVLTEGGFAGLIKDLWVHLIEQVIQVSYRVIKREGRRQFCRNAIGFAYLCRINNTPQ